MEEVIAVLNELRSKLIEDVERCETYLSDGGCETLADYKFVAGEIRGLSTAIMHINDQKQIRTRGEE